MLIAHFDGMAWQRSRRRAGQHTAIISAEQTFVARADQLVPFGVEIHRALQVRAALAIGGKSVGREVNQDARLSFGRITEKFRAADRNFVRARDEFGLGRDSWREHFAFGEPGRPENRGGATGEHGELAPRQAMFFRLANWKIGVPVRFVGHDGFEVPKLKA